MIKVKVRCSKSCELPIYTKRNGPIYCLTRNTFNARPLDYAIPTSRRHHMLPSPQMSWLFNSSQP